MFQDPETLQQVNKATHLAIKQTQLKKKKHGSRSWTSRNAAAGKQGNSPDSGAAASAIAATVLGNRGGGGLYREIGDERLSNEGINEGRMEVVHLLCTLSFEKER
jgi:hypothetical protein